MGAATVALVAGLHLGENRGFVRRRTGMLPEAPAAADLRLSVEKDFDLGVRKYFCADIAALHHHAACRTHLTLSFHHPGAHRRMDGNARSSFGDILLANARCDVESIEQNAIAFAARLKFDARLLRQRRQRFAVVKGPAL